MNSRLLMCALALAAPSLLAAAASPEEEEEDRLRQLILDSPCMIEYRMWLINGSDAFETPTGLTDAQCRTAILLHRRIEPRLAALQQRESLIVNEDRRIAAAQATTVEAARRARQAALPGPRIGMTLDDVGTRTRWGWPPRIRRTTTAGSVVEYWFYDDDRHLVFRNGRLAVIEE